MRLKITAVILLVFSTSLVVSAQRVLENNPDVTGVDIVENFGAQVPADLTFVNEKGDSLQIGSLFNKGKPILLSLVYYQCPMLCTLVLNGKVNGMRQLAWLPGAEYQAVSISIDPSETPTLAADKKDRYLKSLDKSNVDEEGWTFLVGAEDQIKKLADTLGFHYFYDQEKEQYAHPAVLFLLAEDGTITRYLYGIEYKEQDLRLGLLEASQGKIGNALDRLILYCYQYDPGEKGYVVFAGNVMRIGGTITLICIIFLLAMLWMRERKRHA